MKRDSISILLTNPRLCSCSIDRRINLSFSLDIFFSNIFIFLKHPSLKQLPPWQGGEPKDEINSPLYPLQQSVYYR